MRILDSGRARFLVGLVAAAVLFAVGTFSGPYQAQIATLAAIYVILASSLNLLLGYSGLLSLGHQAFFGFGAYCSAYLTTNGGVPVPLGLLGSAAAGFALAWVIGKITLRLRAAFFVIATFAVAAIGRQVALNWVGVTGGPVGFAGIPALGVGDMVFFEPTATFPICFVIAGICVLFVSRLSKSGLGYSLRGMAKNENLARAVGIDTARHANLAFSIGGAMAAVAGSLYAHTVGFISPEVFDFSIMINTLLMVIGGGLGTVVGPVVGAILFTQLPEFLRFSDEWRLVIYGAILVLLVRFLPRGLWGSAAELVRGLQRRSSDDDPEGGPPYLRDEERPTDVEADDPLEIGSPRGAHRVPHTMPSLRSAPGSGGVE
jgi:branched-chain amino acid transport system permease protein